jgi:hypothetical protein
MNREPEKTEDGFTIIYGHDQLPVFGSEAEEREFWEWHTWSEEMMDVAARGVGTYPLPPARTRSTAVNVRFEDRRLKRLARVKGMGYQTLLKAFVQERLYEEEKLSKLR